MASALPNSVRTRVYLVGVALLLLASFAGAMGQLTGYSRFVGPVYLPVLGTMAAAVIGLLWLRPNGTQYALGSACLLIAIAGTWINTPAGGRWLATTLDDPQLRISEPIRYIPLLFFAGWVLLGASIGNWKIGFVSYIGAGLTFQVLAGAISTWLWGARNFGLGPDPVPALAISVLLWPVRILVMLGTFGSFR